MLEAYTDVAVFLAVGALFVIVNLAVGRLFRPHRPYSEKLTTYECGEQPSAMPGSSSTRDIIFTHSFLSFLT